MREAEVSRVKVQAYKFGDRLHYEWETLLLERTDDYVVLLGEAGRKLKHHTKGQTFEMSDWTIEWFSFVDGFTVSASVRDGRIAQYYCNINLPSTFEDGVVAFVDLDLDYVWRDGVWRVVDEDEFEAHSVVYGYPAELIYYAREQLLRLQERVERNVFPFDGTLERLLPELQARFFSKASIR